jgi:hypothetical protein
MQPSAISAFDAAVLAGRAPDESTLRSLFSSTLIPSDPAKIAAFKLLGVKEREKQRTYGYLSYAFLTRTAKDVAQTEEDVLVAEFTRWQARELQKIEESEPDRPKEKARVRRRLITACARTRKAAKKGEFEDIEDAVDFLREEFYRLQEQPQSQSRGVVMEI